MADPKIKIEYNVTTAEAEQSIRDGVDPGIRRTVAFLRDRGFDTIDSGDGVTKRLAGDLEALDYPHVFIKANAGEQTAFLAASALKLAGVLVSPTTRADGIHVEYSADVMTPGSGIVIVRGLDDSRLPRSHGFDLVDHLRHQKRFSERTFGPGPRPGMVVAHIRKELEEIERDPNDVKEWIDVILLAFDGALRLPATPEFVAAALEAKLLENERRRWPDWREADPTKPIEHVREAQS